MPEPADVGPEPATAPAGPPRTRETASDGYRRALAVHREAAPELRADPHIAEAVERQTAAMRELSRRAFLEPDVVADDVPASIEATRAQRRRQAAAAEAAALRRSRHERAWESGTHADVPQSAALRDTAEQTSTPCTGGCHGVA
ncbi:hypothetical protein [Streptomyces sp. NPDC006739]|uniref:hypothetical protein n=1 Tax=Streptomyces sp. NPDC006739 TaxID=3364763 RepID=UPI0036945FF9